MALVKSKLCVVGSGGDNSIHLYTTNDADTVVETADYFLGSYTSLRVGDWIMANIDMDGTPESKIYTVLTSTSAGVTIGFPTIT